MQLKIVETRNAYGDGIFLGISNSKTTEKHAHLSNNTICLYNNATSLNHVNIRVLKPCTAVQGDVIGVVVDMDKDQVRFYINGHLVAVGIPKASAMKPIYAVMWLFYKDMKVEMGDYYLYHELEAYSGDN